MAPRKKENLSQEQWQRATAVLMEMTVAMRTEVYTPDGLLTVPVKLHDDTYKTLALDVGQELIFKEFYLSKTGTPIAVFEPVGHAEWKQAELNFKNLDTYFPLFASTLADRVGLSDEIEEIQVVYDALIKRAEEAWQKQEEERKREEAAKIAAEQERMRKRNPLWGRF